MHLAAPHSQGSAQGILSWSRSVRGAPNLSSSCLPRFRSDPLNTLQLLRWQPGSQIFIENKLRNRGILSGNQSHNPWAAGQSHLSAVCSHSLDFSPSGALWGGLQIPKPMNRFRYFFSRPPQLLGIHSVLWSERNGETIYFTPEPNYLQ